MNIRYAPFTSDVVDGAAQLFVQVFNSPPWNEQWSSETASRRLTELLESSGSIGIAAFDETIVGIVIAVAEQRYNGRQFQIRELCVSPVRRRVGIGRNLLSALTSVARASGGQELCLATTRGTPAERFYTELGFAVVPSEVFLARPL